MRITAPLLVLLTLVSTVCSESPKPQNTRFDQAFELVRTVVIEEPDSAPLTGIRNFQRGTRGRLIVVDAGRPQVRLFDSTGTLLQIVGRYGDGPGEFRAPSDAVMDMTGALFVADAEDGTVTRFTSEFAFDTVFAVPGFPTYDLDRRGEDLLAVHWNEPNGKDDHYLSLLSRDGELQHRLHEVDSLVWSVPYWSSFAGPLGAASESRIVSANMFLYPLHLYDNAGRHLRSLNDPPPSWRPPTRPEAGAFIGVAGRARLDNWLRSSTVISRLGIYRDEAIIVVHAKPAPSVTDFYARTDTLLDLYGITGGKLAEDLVLPGRVLRIEDHLYLLESSPPEPWRVGIYRLRSDRF